MEHCISVFQAGESLLDAGFFDIVFSAFDVSASHYLLKPIDTQKLEKVLMKITKELTAEKEYCCTIKSGTQIHRIPFFRIISSGVTKVIW